MEQFIADHMDENGNFTLMARYDRTDRQILRIRRWLDRRTGTHRCRIYHRIDFLFTQLLIFILNNIVIMHLDAVEERIAEIRDCISARRLIRRQQRRLQRSRR